MRVKPFVPCTGCTGLDIHGNTIEITSCDSTFLGGRTSCDPCYNNHRACDGEFLGRDDMLYMALRVSLGQVQPLDPLTPDELNALVNDPGTPGSLADELAAAVVEDDIAADPDFVPSDEDELDSDDDDLIVAGPWHPVFYGEEVPRVQASVAGNILSGYRFLRGREGK